MDQHSVIVISYDGLGCGYLGPYGSTWAPTPVWNELAARSTVLDFSFANGPRLDDALSAWWGGRHPAQSSAVTTWLPETCPRLGMESILVSDDPEALQHPGASAFAQHVRLDRPRRRSTRTLEETMIVRSTLAACEAIVGIQSPMFASVHLSALARAWDVPHEFRAQLADEEDPPPPVFVEPPCGHRADADLDAVWANQLAYAAQMMAIDASLGIVLELIDQLRTAGPVWLVVTSPRGYALGAHGITGLGTGALRTEDTHVPMLLDTGGGPLMGQRLSAVCDSTSLYHLLAGGFARPVTDALPAQLLCRSNSRAVSISDSHRSIRTPSWLYREAVTDSTDEGSRQVELYAKPDDRWDANEIAGLCPEIIEQMRQAVDDFVAAAERDQLDSLDELPPSLVAR